MRYADKGILVPTERRKVINDKIEYIVNQRLTPEQAGGITKDDIFNLYTGKGGLHGLSYGNYNSYYDYQIAKSEIEQGQFFTPYKVVQWIYDCLHVTENDLVADLTSGHGAFISCCPNEKTFTPTNWTFRRAMLASSFILMLTLKTWTSDIISQT